MTLGAAHAALTTQIPFGQEEFGEVVFSGVEWGLCADLGAAVVPNLILHMRALLSLLAGDPF